MSLMMKKVRIYLTLHCDYKFILGLVAETKEGIEDRTETNLVNLRRVIYLTIMNALNYEEAVHKLLKVQLQEGQEVCSSPHLFLESHSNKLSRLNSLT
jgi:hypothetical protein